MNRFAQAAAIQTNAFDCAADGAGQVQQTRFLCAAHDECAAAVMTIRPCMIAGQHHAARDADAPANIIARWHQHAAFDFSGFVQGGLNGLCTVGHAVADGTVCSDIEDMVNRCLNHGVYSPLYIGKHGAFPYRFSVYHTAPQKASAAFVPETQSDSFRTAYMPADLTFPASCGIINASESKITEHERN